MFIEAGSNSGMSLFTCCLCGETESRAVLSCLLGGAGTGLLCSGLCAQSLSVCATGPLCWPLGEVQEKVSQSAVLRKN